ncbi:MAG TPA: response regulator [Polyangiaceae bacterium]|nr:response regulator [Polyangiaceae bacterium]
MQATFRSKLMLIVGTTVLAFLLVTLGGVLIGAREARELADIEGRLVPRLELGPKLGAEFERLRQSIRDAVAAQDMDGLEAASAIKNELLERIGSAGSEISRQESVPLRAAIEDYYATAMDVSRRLIRGETGEVLPEAMRAMQKKQEVALTLLSRATELDRHELAASFTAVRSAADGARRFYLVIGLAALGTVGALSLWLSRGMLRTLSDLSEGFARFGKGDFSRPVPVAVGDELGKVAKEANQMAESLSRHARERDREDWLKSGLAGLSDELRGELDPDEACRRTLRYLVKRVEALAGAIYLRGADGAFLLSGHEGLGAKTDAEPVPSFLAGEALVGRAATSEEIVVIRDPPAGYLRIRSALGEAPPAAIVLVPFVRAGRISGVVELAFFTPCSDSVLEFLASVRELVVVTVEAAQSRAALRTVLEETRQQAERLGVQEEKLLRNNHELLMQQDELQRANEELEAQRRTLAEQNTELEQARWRVQEKAQELAKASEYKSQFLANMSHELRTPLNSMLLLSHLLTQNEARNLTPKQVEYAKTVHSAGTDLLGLINQLLDLAKIEAGRQEVYIDSVRLADIAEQARRLFLPLAAEKNLALVVEVSRDLPDSISTDGQRVERILTNLIGNAIKFTDHGQVRLDVGRPAPRTKFAKNALSPEKAIAFTVSDTGVGIPLESQETVFAAFEQLESRTNRRHGGTGLGLAIARESAILLGGELKVESEPGKGSRFTLYLPERPALLAAEFGPGDAHESPSRAPRTVDDDRASLAPSDVHLLVVEDDPVLAEHLVELIRARKLRAVVASSGSEALRLARECQPQGIILDVKLPDLDGFTVMARLKRDPATSNIPVHFMSAVDTPERGLALGAVGYLTKPATRGELVDMVRTLAPMSDSPGRVLVVEDDREMGESLIKLLSGEHLEAEHVTSARSALEALTREEFGCMILDLGLPDMDGLGLLETIESRPDAHKPPVVVYTARALTNEETRRIEAYVEAVVLKDSHSERRLLDEIRLFIRHVEHGLPETPPSRRSEHPLANVSLSGKKILVADDDMRTVYALSALLDGAGAEVLVADNGLEALEVLSKNPDLHGVLMDMTMPEMDGYDAMRRLRQEARFRSLPVIALTAKAMKGERERCLEAGASDYIAKPVDGPRLLSTLGSWLGGAAKDDLGPAG